MAEKKKNEKSNTDRDGTEKPKDPEEDEEFLSPVSSHVFLDAETSADENKKPRPSLVPAKKPVEFIKEEREEEPRESISGKLEEKSEEQRPARKSEEQQRLPSTTESGETLSVQRADTLDDNAIQADDEYEPSLHTPEKLGHKLRIADYEESDEELMSARIKDVPSVIIRERSLDLRSGQRSMVSFFNTNLRLGTVFVYMVFPPDGGYGWVILLVSFLCQIIVDGILFALGAILPFMANDLGSTKSQIALVASTQIGPISSAFINKFGFRPVALVGAVLSMINITIGSFSQNLPMLIIFYGVLGGASLSLIWCSSQLIIGYYFEKYRPIASGVACSGAGAGVLIFSLMNSVLVREIGWRNTSRVHVCFLVVVLLLAIAYIEVAPTRIGRMIETNRSVDSDSDYLDSDDLIQHLRYSRLTLHNMQKPLEDTYRRASVDGRMVKLEVTPEVSRFQTCCRRMCFCCKQRENEELQLEPRRTNLVIKQEILERMDAYYTGPPVNDNELNTISSRSSEFARDVDVEILSQDEERLHLINYNLNMIHSDHHVAKRVPSRPLSKLQKRHWIPKKMRHAFTLLFDFNLFKIMEFQILATSAFFFTMGFNIPFVYSMVRADIDYQYARFIPSTIGLSNFAFRIISGFIAYKYREATTYICAFGMTFGGAATLLSAFYGRDIVWFQFVYAICFGVAPAFYSTLRAIIYVRCLGLSKLTNAFGLAAMAMGVGVFIGTTTGGFLIQCTDDYVATFIFSGSCITFAGFLKFILTPLVSRKERQKAKKTKVHHKY